MSKSLKSGVKSMILTKRKAQERNQDQKIRMKRMKRNLRRAKVTEGRKNMIITLDMIITLAQLPKRIERKVRIKNDSFPYHLCSIKFFN